MSENNFELNNDISAKVTFSDLDLPSSILKRIEEVGYTIPSPIQLKSIPLLLEGEDVIGQAQTGTGKTAAFALPILSMIKPKSKATQALILAPTRELCIQVCESFKNYSKGVGTILSIPIYGGQSYQTQFSLLKQNPQIVVGTPGRVMDHLRRGTLDISKISTMVLDEADEMLRMGFAEDVEWILEKTPKDKQTVLFSATMPPQIRKLAKKYLNNPKEISIASNNETKKTINQQYWIVKDTNKLDGLSRILEFITYKSIIIFVKTRNQTTELSERLKERGFDALPLNGDIAQKQREQTISLIKRGKVKILIATDVAARGLDIDSIDYVINYDAPFDTETYIHRIGRTGRAGNLGTAILFLSPRESKILEQIEHHTKQKVEKFALPSTSEINKKRINELYARIDGALELLEEQEPLSQSYEKVISDYLKQKDLEASELSQALIHLLHQEKPLLLSEKSQANQIDEDKFEYVARGGRGRGDRRGDRGGDRGGRDRRGGGGNRDFSSRGRKGDFRKKRRD